MSALVINTRKLFASEATPNHNPEASSVFGDAMILIW